MNTVASLPAKLKALADEITAMATKRDPQVRLDRVAGIMSRIAALATPNPVRAEQQECGAIGSQGCTYRPEGPNGEMQCSYCGAEQPEGKGAEFRGLDVSGRPVYGHAKAASVTAAPTSAPAAPVVDDEFADLRTFYNVETDAELIRIQAQHVERLQKKLPRNDQPIRTKPRFA